VRENLLHALNSQPFVHLVPSSSTETSGHAHEEADYDVHVREIEFTVKDACGEHNRVIPKNFFEFKVSEELKII